jgi:hypothetical protein
MKPKAAFFWRKLDHPGHDSCRLFKLPKGWLLSGAAGSNWVRAFSEEFSHPPRAWAQRFFNVQR